MTTRRFNHTPARSFLCGLSNNVGLCNLPVVSDYIMMGDAGTTTKVSWLGTLNFRKRGDAGGGGGGGGGASGNAS